MTNPIIRIVIGEDHRLLIQGYQSLLSKTTDIQIVAVATNFYEVIQKLKTCPCDVLLLDLTMPMASNSDVTRLSGLDVLEFIKKEQLGIKALVISTHRDYEIIKKVTALGAFGYVFKNINYDEFIEAIRAVASGKDYFPKEVEGILTSKLQDEERLIAGGVKITPREKEILKLLSEGMKADDIATLLGLGKYTIEEYRTNLIKKFKAKNTTNLVKKACDFKFI
ncbi:response regulator transcription factor [Dyadobacter sp. CY261]|uniref:response regulator transcription factor n=1 Tax=Dyadobacter sp. CY261 TaxID=2907203 RepID=UPI001F1DE4BE|nr:response regulator transcription factor [Dyadobacter sp. CY261]MCF0070807.1 response regulator transcription factor [Dyadobacter sp. CY261]